MRVGVLRLGHEPARCDELDYINILIAAQQVFSSVEASDAGQRALLDQARGVLVIDNALHLANRRCWRWHSTITLGSTA